MEETNLGFLFDDERRAALGTRFGKRLKRRGEIAIWIARAAKENAWATAAANAAAFHKFAFIALRALNPQRDRAHVLALWIPGAADELAKSSMFFE